jgi:CP family cyanate transporter-like MFS transporter
MTTSEPAPAYGSSVRRPETADHQRRSRASFVVLLVGIMVLSINLRPTITGLPPLFTQLSQRLGLSAIDITMLATLPVLCFGIFSPVAASVSRRLGEERALGTALAVGSLGLTLRAVFPHTLLLVGTVIAGAAIAFMNVLLPSLVKRREPRHANTLLGLYMLMMYVGSISSSAVVVPLYQATRGSLLIALGVLAVPMIIAVVVWLPQLRHKTKEAPSSSSRRTRSQVHRHALAWQVTAFMGLQSLTYYATVSFLPNLFLSRGLPAGETGLIGSLLGIGGLVSGFGVPLIVHRTARTARALVIGTIVACAVGIGAPLVLPVGVGLGLMLLLGLGQGGGITLALYFVMARASTPDVAASLSALSQGVGYVLATLGPLVFGLLAAATNGWVVPALALLVATGVELVVGLLAARDRTVPEPTGY